MAKKAKEAKENKEVIIKMGDIELPHMSFILLNDAAKSGDWSKIDISTIPKAQITGNHYGKGPKVTNLIGCAAQAGKLDTFPKELFSQKGLTKANGIGETPLHFAAINKQLKFIPEEFLTKENFCIPNKDGTTPLHYSLIHVCFDQIPKKFKTPELLKLENNHGFCILDFALFAKKDPSMWAVNFKDKSGILKKIDTQIKEVLSILNDETLKNYALTPITTGFREARYNLAKETLLKRKIIRGLSKKDKSLEI